MKSDDVDRTLTAIERSFQEDPTANVAGTGFWKVVAAAKQDPKLVEEFGERIAALDRKGFERWAMVTLPLHIGTIVALIGTALGVALVGMAYSTDDPANGILLLAGMGALLVASHGLAHLIVGRVAGIRFTHWFVAGIGRPQPGVKTDYASYLAAGARQRAWMHASGAIVSKIVPFALIPAALASGVPGWTTAVLVVVGISTLISDWVLLDKSGDWKKFKREMALK